MNKKQDIKIKAIELSTKINFRNKCDETNTDAILEDAKKIENFINDEEKALTSENDLDNNKECELKKGWYYTSYFCVVLVEEIVDRRNYLQKTVIHGLNGDIDIYTIVEFEHDSILKLKDKIDDEKKVIYYFKTYLKQDYYDEIFDCDKMIHIYKNGIKYKLVIESLLLHTNKDNKYYISASALMCGNNVPYNIVIWNEDDGFLFN